MKWKLNYSEFLVLLTLLQHVCTSITPSGIQANVLHGTLTRLYKKFYLRNLIKRNKYTITVTDDEACAFYMFFIKYNLSGEEIFTINLVSQINGSINKKYAV